MGSELLPASIRSISNGVIHYNGPNHRLHNRYGDSEKTIGDSESPRRVEKKVSMLIENRESGYGDGKLCKTIEHVEDDGEDDCPDIEWAVIV